MMVIQTVHSAKAQSYGKPFQTAVREHTYGNNSNIFDLGSAKTCEQFFWKKDYKYKACMLGNVVVKYPCSL